MGDITLRLMATTKFMLDQHNPQAALHALQELDKSGAKNHPGALLLELKAQQQAGNWNEVLRVLEQLESRSSIDTAVAAQLRQQAYLEGIQQYSDATALTAYLKNMPVDFRRRKKIAVTAARALIALNSCAGAQQILSDSLNVQWDSELVALYGNCASGNLAGQLEQAEKWLNQHNKDAGLLLALGKLCLHQKLWGKAQSYLDASISVSPSHEAYTALGQLAERLGNSTQAFNYYQQAMVLK
jgi:HemY protein